MVVSNNDLSESRKVGLNACFKEWVKRLVASLREAFFGPRIIVCGTVLCGCGAIVNAYAFNWVWLIVAGAIGLLIGALSGKKHLVIIFSLLPVLFAWYCSYRTPAPSDNDISKQISGGRLIFEGQVLDTTTSKSGGSTNLVVCPQRILFPIDVDVGGKVKVTVYGANSKILTGDILRVSGTISQPQHKSYPWQFDYVRFLAKENIFSICSAKSIQIIGHQKVKGQIKLVVQFEAWIDSLRNKMAALHRKNLGQADGDLLTSIVLGNRAVILPDSVNQKYRNVGLSHVLAASGFNISLAVAMVWWLGKRFIRNLWLQTALCWFSTMLYVFLAGASPSVVRAAIMITLALLVKCLFRTLHTPAVLSMTLLAVLIVDPSSILDVGLQLSYLATLGIVIGASPINFNIGSFAMPHWLMESLLLVLLAQASVLPVQLGVFWQIGLFFLPANLLVDPLVPIITILGFASSMAPLLDCGTGFLNMPAQLIDHITWFPLKLMSIIVDYFSSLPNAEFLSRPPVTLAVVVYFLVFAFLLGCLHFRKSRVVALTIWLTSVCGLLWHPELPALTVAVFPNSVVIMDDRHRMYCENEVGHTDAGKFISFFGGKNALCANNMFDKKKYGALTIVYAKCFNIALFDLGSKDAYSNGINVPNERCNVLIVHQQFKDINTIASEIDSNNSTSLIKVDSVSNELHYIETLVDKLHPQWIIIDAKGRKNRLAESLLRKLSLISGSHVLMLTNGAVVLASKKQDNGIVFTPTDCYGL